MDRTRCLMRFERIFDTWRVAVIRDGKTLRELTFADDSKVEEMARRGNGLGNLEAKNMFELAIRNGAGATEIYLTGEQMARLKM